MGIYKFILAGTSLVIVPAFMALPALAQSAATAGTPTESRLEEIPQLEEIIVTAQRREETVQKASISISVLSADDIAKAGITQAQNLAAAVPGLQIGQGGSATQIYIRGVGDFGSTAGTNPAVAFNVDGVYVPRPAAIEGSFYDLQRVEVLKGPQGTLYGRNATGGAINVIPQKPKLGVTETLGSLEVGNYNKVSAEAAVNLPIGENVAVRAAAQLVHRDPYVTMNFDDEIRQSGRLQMLWKASDAATLRVSGDYTHIGGGGGGYVVVPKQPGISAWTSGNDPIFTNYYNNLAVASNQCIPIAPGPTATFTYTGACPALTVPTPGGPVTVPQAQLSFGQFGVRGKQDNVFWNVSAQLDYDLGFATLTVLPAYRKAELDYAAYPGPGTVFDFTYPGGPPETSKATSVETRLAHDSDVVKWVLGGYYFKEDQLGYGHVISGYVQNVLLKQAIGTEAYAGFGQATFSVTDHLRLIAGARYTSDRRTAAPQSILLSPSLGFSPACATPVYPNVIGPGTVGCAGPVLLGNKTFNKFNWKGGVEFDLAEQNMIYATASTGFKAGGFYAGQTATGVAGSYEPETLFSIEAGSRNRFFNNRLQVNFEGFYYDYKNHQEPVVTTDVTGSVVQAIQNAGSGYVHGANLDVTFKLTKNDTMHAGVEWLKSRYSKFGLASPLIVGTPTFLPNGATGCPVTNTFNAAGAGLSVPPTGVGVGTAFGQVLPGFTRGQVVGSQTESCVGFPFTRSPEWSGLASYEHKFDLSNGGNIAAEASMQFASSRYLGTDYLASSLAKAYETYNASLTYHSPGENWSVAGFVRNITDEAVFTATARAIGVVGLNSASIAPPRTYGARVNFKF